MKVPLPLLRGQEKGKAKQEFLIKSVNSTILRDNFNEASSFKNNILPNSNSRSLRKNRAEKGKNLKKNKVKAHSNSKRWRHMLAWLSAI